MLTYNEAVKFELINRDALRFDNPSFDSAVIGADYYGRLIYDYDKMVEELMEVDDISYEDAVDFISYNTLRALDYVSSDMKHSLMEEVMYDYKQ